MFCRGCNYDLRSLGARACPECGAAFDPTNASTWLAAPRPSVWRRGMIVVGSVVAVLLLPVAAAGYVVAIGGAYAAGMALCCLVMSLPFALVLLVVVSDLCRAGEWGKASILALGLSVVDAAWIPLSWWVWQ